MEHRYYSQVDQVGTRADLYMTIENAGLGVFPLSLVQTMCEACRDATPHNVWSAELNEAVKAGRATT